MYNNNFQKFETHGKEIDTNFREIQSKITQFGNSPYGNERLILKITKQILELIDWLF